MLDKTRNRVEQRSLLRARRCREELRIFVRQLGGQLTINQLLVLWSITHNHFAGDRSTVQAIAEEEGICQQTVSGCVRRLEAFGLVVSIPADEDRRVRLLSLADKAVALHDEAQNEVVAKGLEFV